jgi:hypothetical protein
MPRHAGGVSQCHSHCDSLLLQEGGPGTAGEPAAAHHSAGSCWRGGLVKSTRGPSTRCLGDSRSSCRAGRSRCLLAPLPWSSSELTPCCVSPSLHTPPLSPASPVLGLMPASHSGTAASASPTYRRRWPISWAMRTMCQPQRGRPLWAAQTSHQAGVRRWPPSPGLSTRAAPRVQPPGPWPRRRV